MKYIYIAASILGLLFLILGFWLLPLYSKLNKNEKDIVAKEAEIDDIEPNINVRITGSLVTEGTRLKMIEVGQNPLKRQLELLQQQRQFLRDKIPFFKH